MSLAAMSARAMPAPPLAGIAAAAAGADVETELVDALVARWLVATGRLETDIPVDEIATVLPGYGRPSAAYRLLGELLPDWSIDVRGAALVVLTPPADAPIDAVVSGAGPTLGRAILAAIFSALLALEHAAPAPADPMSDLRAALQAEIA